MCECVYVCVWSRTNPLRKLITPLAWRLRAGRVLCPDVPLSTDTLGGTWADRARGYGGLVVTATPETRLWAGLPREAPQTPWSCLKGLPPGELGKGEPRPAPPALPQALPLMSGPSAHTLVSGAGEPLAAAWGCLTARPHGSQSQSPEAAPCSLRVTSGEEWGLVLGPGRGRTPGLATNTLTDAAAPPAPGRPICTQHRFPCLQRA